MVFQSLATQRAVARSVAEARAGNQRGYDAGRDARSPGAGILCTAAVQHRVLCTTILVGTDNDDTC